MRTPMRHTPLSSCLAAALALASPITAATDRTVVNCANTGTGSLRSAVASAVSGDRIVFDTGQMNCSSITLTSGQIEIAVQELTLQGPIASTVTIGGFHASRVFFDYGDHDRKLTINNLTIANGTMQMSAPSSIVQGGCILTSGDLVLSASTVTGCIVSNQANSGFGAGGGVASYRLHMLNSVISNNRAYGYANALGGGVFVQDETQILGSTISGNHSQASTVPGFASGGGFAGQSFFGGAGGIQISSSTITLNESDFGGGAVMFYGASARTLQIDHSIISGNKARRYAGAVEIYDSKASPVFAAAIIDSTISGNRSYGLVGGVYSSASLAVSNSTIAFNRADSDTFNVTYHMAAGLSTYAAATLQSSIIAKNTLGANTGSDLNCPFGATMAGSSNLIMVTLAGTNAPGGTSTADPLLVALANNGGPTLTHQLQPGSPAIGAGNNLAQLASDQRGPGFARSTAGKTDIGAFQTGDGIFYGGFD